MNWRFEVKYEVVLLMLGNVRYINGLSRWQLKWGAKCPIFLVMRSIFCWYHTKSVPRLRSARHLVLFLSKHHHRQTITPDNRRGRGISHQSRLFYITDVSTKQQFLIDTGAEVSVLPPRPSDRTHRQGYDLQAANSSTIATYGTRSLTINLGLRRSFPWITSRSTQDR